MYGPQWMGTFLSPGRPSSPAFHFTLYCIAPFKQIPPLIVFLYIFWDLNPRLTSVCTVYLARNRVLFLFVSREKKGIFYFILIMYTIWHLLCSLPIDGVHHAHFIPLIMFIVLHWLFSYLTDLMLLPSCLSCSLPCIDHANYLALITLITLDRTRLLPCIDHAHVDDRHPALSGELDPGDAELRPLAPPLAPLSVHKIYILLSCCNRRCRWRHCIKTVSITKAISQDPFR